MAEYDLWKYCTKEQIHEMVAEGAEVECRAVPTDKKVMAESLI